MCVFCGSSGGTDPDYRAAAEAFGRELAKRDIELVYGGGAVGLMGALADAVMTSGGSVTGVLPEGLFPREVGHTEITALHLVPTMHERKAMMYDLADAFVALPGGLGTLDELFETLTWAQIGLHAKPVGLLDTKDFFASLLAFVRHTVEEGFVKPANLDLLRVAGDPATLLDELSVAQPVHVPKWIGADKL